VTAVFAGTALAPLLVFQNFLRVSKSFEKSEVPDAGGAEAQTRLQALAAKRGACAATIKNCRLEPVP
jgi:hypothetical protein